MPDDSARASTPRQLFHGIERRRVSREPGPAAIVIGRARRLTGYYPSLRPEWYPVIDRNREALEPIARPGYLWLEVDGRPRHVWAAHFEVELPPP